MPMGGPLSLWEKPSCKKLRGPMGGTKSKPNAVDSIWNGGARERQNECAMSFAIEMKKLVASDMSLATSWRRRRDSNPRTYIHFSLRHVIHSKTFSREKMAERVGFEPTALASHRFSRPAP